jgi:hypothetical protein
MKSLCRQSNFEMEMYNLQSKYKSPGKFSTSVEATRTPKLIKREGYLNGNFEMRVKFETGAGGTPNW